MSYYYIQSERGDHPLWTVGHDHGDGFEPESDHSKEEDAAARVHWLNGGGPRPAPPAPAKGDSETRLLATVDQCDELIAALRQAKKDAKRDGEAHYARMVLEQASARGPWRLIVGVLPPDGPNA